jgi:hypothetical protein
MSTAGAGTWHMKTPNWNQTNLSIRILCSTFSLRNFRPLKSVLLPIHTATKILVSKYLILPI